MTANTNAPQCRKTTIVLPLAVVPESCDVEVNDSHHILESFLYDKGSPMPKEVQALKEGDQVRIAGPAKDFPEEEIWVVEYIDLPGYDRGAKHFATLGIAFPGGRPKRYSKEQYQGMVQRHKAMAAASKRAQEAGK